MMNRQCIQTPAATFSQLQCDREEIYDDDPFWEDDTDPELDEDYDDEDLSDPYDDDEEE